MEIKLKEKEIRALWNPAWDPTEFFALLWLMQDKKKELGLPTTFMALCPSKNYYNIGWWQDLDTTLNYENCKKYDVAVCRRAYMGGGAILHGPGIGTLAGMCLNKDEIPDLYRFWNLFGARAWLKAYDKLGVENVRFDAIGDFVRIDDERKMTGYAVSGSKDVYFIGGIITANPLNMDLFMETSMIPKEKFADKKARDSRSWVADVSEILGRKIDVEEVYKALVAAYQEELGVQFVAGELTDEEKRLLPEYVKNLSSEEVIQRCSCRKFAERAPKEAKIDAFNYKVEKLLRPIVAIKEDKIVDIMLTGDWYIYPAEVIDEIEEAMKGMPIDEHKIYLELTKIWEKHPDIEDFWCDPCFFAHAIAAAGKSAKEL